VQDRRASAEFPEAKRLLGALANSRGHRHEENAAKLVNTALELPLPIGAALLSAAEGYTPRATQLIEAARERLGTISEVAEGLAENLPPPKLTSGRSRRRKRRRKKKQQQAQQAEAQAVEGEAQAQDGAAPAQPEAEAEAAAEAPPAEPVAEENGAQPKKRRTRKAKAPAQTEPAAEAEAEPAPAAEA
jgi:hypothetical protein